MGESTSIITKSLDEYLWLLENEFLGNPVENSMYNRRVRVTMIPESVEIKTDWFCTSLGLLVGSLILMPTITKSLNIKPAGYNIIFRYYPCYTIWKPKEDIVYQHKQNIVVGEKRSFIVRAYPVGLMQDKLSRQMCYFILAYEKNGETIWLK